MNQELIAEDLTANGFIRQIVSDDVMTAARDMAGKAAGLAPMAVAAMKTIVREGPEPSEIEEMVRQCAFSDDVVEGLSAMREKRIAVFQGK